MSLPGLVSRCHWAPAAALILREGLVNGFRVAAGAAVGVAIVDTVYCLAAALTGAAAAPVPGTPKAFLTASGALVAAIGARQLIASMRGASAKPPWCSQHRLHGP